MEINMNIEKLNPNACYNDISLSYASQAIGYQLNRVGIDDICNINVVISAVEYLGERLLSAGRIDEYVTMIDRWRDFVANDEYFDPVRESDKGCINYKPEWAFHTFCGSEMYIKNKVTAIYDIVRKRFAGRAAIRHIVTDCIKQDSYDYRDWTCEPIVHVGGITEYVDIVVGRTPKHKTAIMTIPGRAKEADVSAAREYADKLGLKPAVVCAEKFSDEAIAAAKTLSVSLYHVYACMSYVDKEKKISSVCPQAVLLEKVKGTKNCAIIDNTIKQYDGETIVIEYSEDMYRDPTEVYRDIRKKHRENLEKYSSMAMDRIMEVEANITGISCLYEVAKSVYELDRYRDGDITAEEAQKRIAEHSNGVNMEEFLATIRKSLAHNPVDGGMDIVLKAVA